MDGGGEIKKDIKVSDIKFRHTYAISHSTLMILAENFCRSYLPIWKKSSEGSIAVSKLNDRSKRQKFSL